MEFRYNPFWFDSRGNPTENLDIVIATLEGTFKRRLSTIFRRFDISRLSFYVVGSNARGDWRSSSDASRIDKIFSELKEGIPLHDEDMAYLRQFYSETELSHYLNPKDKDFLDYGKVNVSDLDIIVNGKSPKKAKDVITEFEVNSLRKNEFWNGGIHILYGHVVPPYYSHKEKSWNHDISTELKLWQ